jgi:predicted nuclease of predicted toxin-antitoxin system
VRFLVDADLPHSTKDLMQRYGHEATDVRDIGLGTAEDCDIAAYAQAQRACLITGDFGFADIRNYPPEAYAGIVVLELPRNATASFILHLIEDFLQQSEVLSKLAGRLAVVEPGRVRLRPS